jgi:hypothetical protein
VLRHCRPYLWGRHFLVRTNHYSLKFLLGKLLGFDFAVEYKPGSPNIIIDTLLCHNVDVVSAFLLVTSQFSFIYRIHQANDADPAPVALSEDIQTGRRATPWPILDRMVTFHNDGHGGIQRTLHRLRRDFHTPNLRSVV